MKSVRAAKFGYICASIVGILIGIVFLLWPDMTIRVLCGIVGAVILLSGVAKLFGYFTDDLYRLAFQYDLALGIMTVIFGVFMMAAPDLFSKILVYAVAIYGIINALFTMQTAVEAKRFGIGKWWLLLVGALVSAAIGVLLLIKPFESAAAVTRLIGIAFIADGIQNLFVAMLTIQIREK